MKRFALLLSCLALLLSLAACVGVDHGPRPDDPTPVEYESPRP